jgi:hypothetical protein
LLVVVVVVVLCVRKEWPVLIKAMDNTHDNAKRIKCRILIAAWASVVARQFVSESAAASLPLHCHATAETLIRVTQFEHL